MAGFQKAGPNQALIVSGGWQRPKIVVGRRVFVIPVLQKVQTLSLETIMVRVESPKVYTKQGVAISAVAMAAVKVAESEDAIRIAARQFLGRTVDEVADLAREILVGHQRSVLGAMTVEQILETPDAIARQIRKSSSDDMAKMGLEIVSLVVHDIRDDGGYLDALGVGRAAEVKRDAAIKRAEAERDAGIRNAQTERERQAARYEADTAIAESRRAYDVQKAEYEREVNTRQAEAELAYQLQEAKTKQAILQEEEVDESYFGGRRKGKRGRGAAGKVPVFGLLKRGGRVYTKIIPDARSDTLIPIIKRKVVPDSIVYSDCWKAYNVLDISDFKHLRINHSKLFADQRNHINGIENFWNQAKRHMGKFNGVPKEHFPLFLKEYEWRFNNPKPKAQLKQIKQWVKEYLS